MLIVILIIIQSAKKKIWLGNTRMVHLEQLSSKKKVHGDECGSKRFPCGYLLSSNLVRGGKKQRNFFVDW